MTTATHRHHPEARLRTAFSASHDTDRERRGHLSLSHHRYTECAGREAKKRAQKYPRRDGKGAGAREATLGDARYPSVPGRHTRGSSVLNGATERGRRRLIAACYPRGRVEIMTDVGC